MNKAEIDIKYILQSGLKALKITHTGQKSNYLSAFFLLLLEWSIKGEGGKGRKSQLTNVL